MDRIALRAVRRSVAGSSASASASSCSFTLACSRSPASLACCTAARAWKNWSWAALNRPHRASSSVRPARPASFQDRISSRNALAVGPQSVEDASSSAWAQSFSLRVLAASRSPSRPAKYALRFLVNALRAAENRFHSAVSTARSACGAAFHSSSSWRIRSPLIFQCVASATIRSASATIRSLTSLASALACSRAALAFSRR